MEWNGKSEYELKKSIIILLAKLSKVDDVLTPSELKFLHDIGRSFEFSSTLVDSLIENNKEETIIPTAEKERMTILYYLLFLMKIDGDVNQKEENMIYHYGFKLGFNQGLIGEMLDIMKKYIGQDVPPSELINTIKKYLN